MVGGEEVDGAGEGGVGEGAEGAVEGIFFVGGFVEVGDAEDGEVVAVGEEQERAEEGADEAGGGGVGGAEEGGEGVEDEEAGVFEVGEVLDELPEDGGERVFLFGVSGWGWRRSAESVGVRVAERAMRWRSAPAAARRSVRVAVESSMERRMEEVGRGFRFSIFDFRLEERIGGGWGGEGVVGAGESCGEVDGEEGFAGAGVAEEEGEGAGGERRSAEWWF